MMKFINKQVQELIGDIEMFDHDNYDILMKLRDIIFSHNHEIQERVMYGGIMLSLESDFVGLFVRKNHVSLEFGFGVYFKDPNGVLEGTGKLRRHLKLRSLKDIETKNVAYFVEQALTMEIN
jgi:hypothetical protein